MDYNYSNLGCLGWVMYPFVAAVITAILFSFASQSITGPSASIFYPPLCLVPWLVITLFVWIVTKLGSLLYQQFKTPNTES